VELQASLATARTHTYTVIWHNANPTAMNDRNYVYLCGDDVAGNSLASSCTLRTCTTTVANYSVQVMGSPDYVGTPHQVLDGTVLDLVVSADFLCGGMIVDLDVIPRGGFAVGDVSFTTGYAFAVRGALAVVGMAMRSEVVVGGDGVAVGGMCQCVALTAGPHVVTTGHSP
jgi:hypothetical protein